MVIIKDAELEGIIRNHHFKEALQQHQLRLSWMNPIRALRFVGIHLAQQIPCKFRNHWEFIILIATDHPAQGTDDTLGLSSVLKTEAKKALHSSALPMSLFVRYQYSSCNGQMLFIHSLLQLIYLKKNPFYWPHFSDQLCLQLSFGCTNFLPMLYLIPCAEPCGAVFFPW